MGETPQAVQPDHRGGRARRAAAVAVAGFFLLTFHGFLDLAPARSAFETTESIVEDRDFTPERSEVGVEGPEAEPHGEYGIGLPVLAVPFYVAGRLIAAGTGHRDLIVEMAFTALMPVAYGVLFVAVHRLARRLGGSPRSAFLVAFGSIFGTFLLAYAQAFFAAPVVALLLAAATERLLADRPAQSGTLLALGVLTMPQTAVVVPFFAAAAFLRGRWEPVVRLGVPLAVGAVVLLVYNNARFGDPFSIDYEGEGFGTPFLEGAGGLLFGPEKSVVLFAPAVLLVPFALVRLARRDPPAALVAGGSVAAVFVWSAMWHAWEGGWSWGPRLLVPVVPLALATLAPWLDDDRLRRVGARALFLVGFAVSAPTLLVPTTMQMFYEGHGGDDGPAVYGQYELVGQAIDNTVTARCEDATQVPDDRHCQAAVWQVHVVRETGVSAWIGTYMVSLVLLAVVIAGVVNARKASRSGADRRTTSTDCG